MSEGKKAKNKKTGLTDKQEAFIQGISAGKGQAEAYRDAYNTTNMKDNTIYSEAYKLTHYNQYIANRLKELQKQAEKGAILDRQQRQALLTEFAMDEDASNTDRLSAIDKLNKMSGDYSETILQETRLSGGLDIKAERRAVIDDLMAEIGIETPEKGEK